MSQGVEHVESALKLIESASGAMGRLEGVDKSWRSGAVARLAATADLLRATRERFFLKTRLCLPFAGKCEATAQELDALLAYNGFVIETKYGDYDQTPFGAESEEQLVVCTVA